MDLFTLIKVVVSRWRVVVPIAVLTLGLAYLVQSTTPPEYQASGYLVLETPELDAAEDTTPVVDPVRVADGIQLEGESAGRNFTVTLLGGANYSVAASAPTADQAEDDVAAVVGQLAERIAALQGQDDVPDNEQVELRMVDPTIVAELQPDEATYVATATTFLNDPAQGTMNPYLANSSTGRLLQVAVMGDAGQAEFSQQTGGGISLTVAQEARDAAPLLQVVTVGSDPQSVIDGFYVAQEIMSTNLDARQARADVLPSQRITLGVLDAPLGVSDESPPVDRATAGVVALGGLLALGLAIGLEGLDRRKDNVGAIRTLIGPGPQTTNAPSPTSGSRAPDLAPPVPSKPDVAPIPNAPAAPSSRVGERADLPTVVTEAESSLESKLRVALAERSSSDRAVPPPNDDVQPMPPTNQADATRSAVPSTNGWKQRADGSGRRDLGA